MVSSANQAWNGKGIRYGIRVVYHLTAAMQINLSSIMQKSIRFALFTLAIDILLNGKKSALVARLK